MESNMVPRHAGVYSGAERRRAHSHTGRAHGAERRRAYTPPCTVGHGSVMEIDKGRFMDDRDSLEALINCMHSAEKAEYKTYGALEMLAGFPNRQLVVYTLRRGVPVDVLQLRLGNLQMVDYGGPVVEVFCDGKQYEIGPVPAKLFRDRDLYLQIAQRFEFKWKGKVADNGSVQFAPHYVLLTKTLSKVFHQVEFHTYCETLNQFRERFPEVPVRY